VFTILGRIITNIDICANAGLLNIEYDSNLIYLEDVRMSLATVIMISSLPEEMIL
jgi:hypothetical protein